MKLNIRAQTAQNQHNNSPIVLVHGLFGSLDNLGVLARDLVNDHNIIQVDMRNHGLSPREPVMNYPAMAQDLVDTLDAPLTALAPDRIDKLVAIDIAPVDYHVRRHDEIFAAINAVSESDAQTRQQAAAIMRQHLNEEGVIQFLLKSFVDGEWRFNVPVLWGGNSPYVSEQYRDDLLAQFPQARAHVIAGAGHWVHAEKPDAVLRAIRRYLND
ncbi:MAG: esterase [Escherichia coli]|nr:esterase [Escherichia coli]